LIPWYLIILLAKTFQAKAEGTSNDKTNKPGSKLYISDTTAGLPIGDNNIIDKKKWVRRDNGTSLYLY